MGTRIVDLECNPFKKDFDDACCSPYTSVAIGLLTLLLRDHRAAHLTLPWPLGCSPYTSVAIADDTQVLVSGRETDLHSTIANLEITLDALSAWFSANGLKVNAEKTPLMVFGSRQNLRGLLDSVTFRDWTLRPCEKVRNLGVIFDPSLTWYDHVTALTRKCFVTLIGLSHVRHLLPADIIAGTPLSC